jgi:hypothetical protein
MKFRHTNETQHGMSNEPPHAAIETKHKQRTRSDGILDTILDAIGDTPLVRLNRVIGDRECAICAKCEFFNA